MVDLILDAAGQKGTGKWTVISAADLGVPLTLIAEAVFARCLSAQKDERVAAAKVLKGPHARRTGGRAGVGRRHRTGALRQQDRLLRPGLRAHGRAGTRIEVGDQPRRRRPDVARRMHHPQRVPGQDQGGVRPRTRSWPTSCSTRTSATSSSAASSAGAGPRWRPLGGGIPAPAMTAALAYFDGYRCAIAAREPAPGPARLFRRPSVRAGRPPSRPVLPHQLDRPRRHDGVVVV